MFYREMPGNDNMSIGNEGMPNPQEMPNTNQTNPMQQSEMGTQGMHFMCYPMMNGMYNPSMYGSQMPQMYGSQMPQQQYPTKQPTGRDMERAPYYNHGNYQHHNYQHHNNYGYGYNQGYDYDSYNPYYQNYNPYSNYYSYYPSWFGENYEY